MILYSYKANQGDIMTEQPQTEKTDTTQPVEVEAVPERRVREEWAPRVVPHAVNIVPDKD